MAATLWGLLGGPPLRAQDIGLPLGTVPPAVTVTDLDGAPFDFATVVGKKPVLVEFWATWCALCKSLLPELERVRARFGDRVELIGVNVTVNDPKPRVRRYLAEHRPPFRALYDEKGAAVRAYDAPSTSYIVVLDARGRVVYTGTGDRQDLVAAVERALGR